MHPISFSQAQPRAPLEPSSGIYFGVNLDWGSDSVASFTERFGTAPAVYVQFLSFPLREQDLSHLSDFGEQVLAVHGIALLTLEPSIPLNDLTAEHATSLAGRLAAFNVRGLPFIIRFAHEMNGSWYSWGEQPLAYVPAFRLVADAVHALAPQNAMLWAPNYGGGYPFSGGRYEARPGTAEFDALDTNRDGRLDMRDDMYGPYYPGDEVVDWVGMTFYHWGARWPWGDNVLPEANKFALQLTGEYAGSAGDERSVPDFYAAFVEGKDKPLAMPETSALFNTAAQGAPELEIKQLWWRQVFTEGTLERFPRLRMINWFEWRKQESEVGGAVVDWRLTSDPEIVSAFLSDLPRERFLFAPDLVSPD